MSIDPKKIKALVGGPDSALIESLLKRAPSLVAAAEHDPRGHYSEADQVVDRLSGMFGRALTPAQTKIVKQLKQRLAKVFQENEHRL